MYHSSSPQLGLNVSSLRCSCELPFLREVDRGSSQLQKALRNKPQNTCLFSLKIISIEQKVLHIQSRDKFPTDVKQLPMTRKPKGERL